MAVSADLALDVLNLLQPEEGRRIDPMAVRIADSTGCPLALAFQIDVMEAASAAKRLVKRGRINDEEKWTYTVAIDRFMVWWDGGEADNRARKWNRRARLAQELKRRGWL